MRESFLVNGHIVLLVLVLAGALGGSLWEVIFRTFRARVRWHTRTGARALSQKRLIELGAVGRFAGVLRVEGEAAECFEGRACAVATVAARGTRDNDFASTSSRAKRLVLETGEKRTVLLGAVDVITPGVKSPAAMRPASISAWIVKHAGAENAWLFDQSPAELRRVRDGERVQVAGRVTRRAERTGGYRVTASGLAIEGEGGPVLVTPVRARGRAWRGACVGAFLALVGISTLAEARVGSMEFISFLHRTDALTLVVDQDLEHLTHTQLEARLLLLDENAHAGRAATLRSLTRMEESLAEANLGTDVGAAREALLTRLKMPLGPEFVEAWLTLAERMNTACRKTGECAGRELALELTETPGRWGASLPNRDLFGVLFSQEDAHERGQLTLVMGRGLLSQGSKGQTVSLLRARWLLEYAAVLIQLGDADGADTVLEATDRSITNMPRLASAPLRRDMEDLREVIALRTYWLMRSLRCTGCRDLGWCRPQHRLEDPCHPMYRAQVRAYEGYGELPIGFSIGLRTARVSGRLSTPPEQWWIASHLEYVGWFTPHLDPAVRTSLVEQLLDEHKCDAEPTVAGVVRELSRERALERLGAAKAAARVRECVERGRRVLLPAYRAMDAG